MSDVSINEHALKTLFDASSVEGEFPPEDGLFYDAISAIENGHTGNVVSFAKTPMVKDPRHEFYVAGVVIDGVPGTMVLDCYRHVFLSTPDEFLKAAADTRLIEQTNGCLAALKHLADKTGENSPAAIARQNVVAALKGADYTEERFPALA